MNDEKDHANEAQRTQDQGQVAVGGGVGGGVGVWDPVEHAKSWRAVWASSSNRRGTEPFNLPGSHEVDRAARLGGRYCQPF